MNRNDFVAPDGQPWWLRETHIDSQTDEARRQLGMALGFSENEWYADANRRTALYDLLESKGSNLLSDLDKLSDDAAKLQWVQSVTTLAAPPDSSQEDTPSPAQPAQGSAEEEAPPAAPAVAPPAAPAVAPPVKKSIFKAKQDDSAPATNGDTEAPGLDQAAQTVPADVAGGAAPPVKKSIFKAKQDDPAPATNGDTEAPGLDQAVQTVLADVTGGGLAGLASDLGVEAEELEAIVNHPDFERDVREELARITAG